MSEIGLYEAMSTCRAVRRLRPDPIPDDVLARVLRAATWAPTGGNAQPWRIVMVRDPSLKKSLAELYFEVWNEYSTGSRQAIAALDAARKELSDSSVR